MPYGPFLEPLGWSLCPPLLGFSRALRLASHTYFPHMPPGSLASVMWDPQGPPGHLGQEPQTPVLSYPLQPTLWPVPSSGAAHHCPGTRTVQRLWGRHREDVCLLLFRSSWVTWGVTSTECCAGSPMSSISRGTCFLRPVPVLGKEHSVIRNAASVALWRSAILPDPSMVQITPQPEG